MKDLSLIVWLTQLGFSVAFPLAGCIIAAIWLRDNLGWGEWVIWAGVILGVAGAVEGLLVSLKAMSRLAKSREEKPPPVAFNDHD